MYLLSNLIETYLWSDEHFNRRITALYLLNWITEVSESGYRCKSMNTFQNDFDVSQAKSTFESIINESGLLEKHNVTEINDEFLFKISLYEYQHGYYDSACDFLYFKKHVADKLHFPYTLDYSSRTDEYYTADMKGTELENYVFDFLKDNDIVQNQTST